MKPAEILLQLCQQHKIILGAAESCTGGRFASRLTQIPGASASFAGAIVSYQNKVKAKVLGVPETLLEEEGAVSMSVARFMLEGALRALSADIGVAITGIAGPDGGTETTPVGTVYIALGGKSFGINVLQMQLEGTRIEIMEEAVDIAIAELINLLQQTD